MFLQETEHVKTLWLPSLLTCLQPLVALALREKKDLTPRQHKQASKQARESRPLQWLLERKGPEEQHSAAEERGKGEGKGSATEQLIIFHSKTDMLTPAPRIINWRLQEMHSLTQEHSKRGTRSGPRPVLDWASRDWCLNPTHCFLNPCFKKAGRTDQRGGGEE